MRVLTGAAVAVIALFAAASANATIIYQTDFEAPAFTAGGIGGQNGWLTFGAPGASTIDTGAPIDGLQSLKITGSAAPGQSGPYHADPSGISKVTLSADLLLTDTGTANRAWQFSAIGAGLAGFTGGIDIDPNGTIHAITAGFGTIGSFSRNTVHRVDILLD